MTTESYLHVWAEDWPFQKPANDQKKTSYTQVEEERSKSQIERKMKYQPFYPPQSLVWDPWEGATGAWSRLQRPSTLIWDDTGGIRTSDRPNRRWDGVSEVLVNNPGHVPVKEHLWHSNTFKLNFGDFNHAYPAVSHCNNIVSLYGLIMYYSVQFNNPKHMCQTRLRQGYGMGMEAWASRWMGLLINDVIVDRSSTILTCVDLYLLLTFRQMLQIWWYKAESTHGQRSQRYWEERLKHFWGPKNVMHF